MKWTLLGPLLLSFSLQASPLIDEQLYIFGSVDQVKDLIDSGSVIVDHVEEHGFELYGPEGLGDYLSNRGIHFFIETADKNSNQYPSFEELTNTLHELEASRPDIFKLFSIGKSVQGRDLWVMKISDNVELDEVEPEFKYISSMHGDEIVGREFSVRLIETIAREYDSNSLIKDLVDNTEIFIMPSMNPDGSHLRRRANARRVDLNRNFPDIVRDKKSSKNGREIETQHLMSFQEQRNFSLSANFHGGTMVVNYPWDSTYTPHLFNDLLVDLSLSYSRSCTAMYESSRFRQGITNGAAWYLVRGGMQDWSSFWHDDLQLTIEVSHKKWPPYSEVEELWQGQKEGLINLMAKIHQGVGLSFDDKKSEGRVMVEMISPQYKNFGSYHYNDGEFYKVLSPGEYRLTLEDDRSFEVLVTEDIQNDGHYVTVPTM
ncbi:MAG: M14 family zinc carboxypeptidase [Bacteriovoracaceae bacterium]